MDSRSRSASPAPLAAAAAEVVEAAPPGALARLGRLLPSAQGLVRFAYRTAIASAASAALMVGAAVRWVAEVTYGLDHLTPAAWAALGLVSVVLLLPAAAAALVGWTLADLVSVPAQLREAALHAAGHAADARSRPREGRLIAVLRSVWAARGLALLSRGAWLRAVGAVRFVRLASLPFALGLLVLFSLNAVVIAGGLLTFLVLLL